MKTFTTTFALMSMALLSMAFQQGSNLTVEVLGHRANSLIVINGQQFSAANNLVRLDGLAPGNYPVKVLRPSYWGNNGVVFSGNIRVPQRSEVTAIITQRGMKVHAEPIPRHTGSYWSGHGNGGYHHAPNPNGNGGFVSMIPTCEPAPEPIICNTPVVIGMHPNQFQNALRSIENATFDSDQVRIAKQIIRTNGASSAQITEMIRLLSFESSRLQVAKFGYRFVADPENYYIVNDVFWFSSSIRELDRFINNF